jgi:putative transposase
MALEAQSGAHSRHAIAMHIVWVTKYRRSVLTRDAGDRCKEIVAEVAAEIGVEIIRMESEVNHVHVVARLKPTHAVADVVKRFKGRSSRVLFQEFPWLKRRLWGGHLWQPSYYAASVGGAPLETIKKYVEGQRSKYH